MLHIIKIAAFMKRHIKALKYMPREDLLYWIMWHKKNNSLAYHIENDRVQSAGVARPVQHPLLMLNYYDFNEGAPFIYADQAASLNPRAFSILIQTMKKRFPYGRIFMFRNCKTNQFRKWDLDRFLEITNMKAKQSESRVI